MLDVYQFVHMLKIAISVLDQYFASWLQGITPHLLKNLTEVPDAASQSRCNRSAFALKMND